MNTCDAIKFRNGHLHPGDNDHIVGSKAVVACSCMKSFWNTHDQFIDTSLFLCSYSNSWERWVIDWNITQLFVVTYPSNHDDVIKWKHFPRFWPFVWGIHRSSVNSPPKGQWRGALTLPLICAWINGWVSNREAGHFRCHRARCNDV